MFFCLVAKTMEKKNHKEHRPVAPRQSPYFICLPKESKQTKDTRSLALRCRVPASVVILSNNPG
jgi:hypothetical protein